MVVSLFFFFFFFSLVVGESPTHTPLRLQTEIGVYRGKSDDHISGCIGSYHPYHSLAYVFLRMDIRLESAHTFPVDRGNGPTIINRGGAPPESIMSNTQTIQIGKGLEIAVDFDRFNTEVINHILYIGARNILMDAHASVPKDEPEGTEKSLAISQKKLEAMYAGELRVATTRESDPVKAEAMRLAVKAIEAALRAKGIKVADVEKKTIRAKAETIREKYMETARKNIEAARAVESDVDLSDLV